jgi:hypothetical protein
MMFEAKRDGLVRPLNLPPQSPQSPLNPPGQWIWLPGTLADIYDVLAGGLHNAPQHFYDQFSGGDPITTVINVLVAACILYSLTMFAMNRFGGETGETGETGRNREEKQGRTRASLNL